MIKYYLYKKWQILSFIKRKGICLFYVRLMKEERLVRQSLSSFCSTSLQHLSASGRCHSLTETVYFASLSLFGLIGSFHNFSPE